MTSSVSFRLRWPAYVESFKMGFWEAVHNRAAWITNGIVFITLIMVFSAIYKSMPLGELQHQGLDASKMLWYFVITEMIVIGAPGVSIFGQQISQGRLCEMLQRPVSMMGMELARYMGEHVLIGGLCFVLAAFMLPLLYNAPIPFSLVDFMLLVVMALLAAFLFNLMAYILGMIEILGPYSRPLSWIVAKFIFTFGGLFFPVLFFPAALRSAVMFTPFPSILYAPASLALDMPTTMVMHAIILQIFWVVVFILIALFAQHRMVRYSLKTGAA